MNHHRGAHRRTPIRRTPIRRGIGWRARHTWRLAGKTWRQILGEEGGCHR